MAVSRGGGGGSERGEGGAPILSETREPFVARRWLATALGGLRPLTAEAAPGYVHAAQWALWAAPVVVPIVMTLLGDGVPLAARVAIGGAAGLLVLVIAHAVSSRIRASDPMAALSGGGSGGSGSAGAASAPADIEKQRQTAVAARAASALGSDEEEYGFDPDTAGCCSPCDAGVCRFLLPGKPSAGVMLVHALAIALVCAAAVYYLDADHLRVRYSDAGAAAFAAFGWLTTAMACFPLVTRAPQELSQFRFSEVGLHYSATLMRAFYVCACVVLDILTRELSAAPRDSLVWANDAGHVLYALLPLAWTFGVTAPPDAFLAWALEQTNVVLLGGSFAATDLRLVGQVITGSVAALVVFAVNVAFAGSDVWRDSSKASTAIIGVAAALGYLLAHNLFPAAVPQPRPEQAAAAKSEGDELSRLYVRTNGACFMCPKAGVAGWSWARTEAVIGALIVVALVGAGIGLQVAGVNLSDELKSAHGPASGGQGERSVDLIWLAVLLAVLLVTLVLLHAPRPVCGGLVRNRLCFQRCSSPTSGGRLASVTYVWLGLVRAALFVYVLVHLSPSTWLLDQIAGPQFQLNGGVGDPQFRAHQLLFALCALRAFRRIWQHTTHALAECALAQVLDVALDGRFAYGTDIVAGYTSGSAGLGGGFGVRLLLCGLFVSRARDALQKLEYMFVHTITCFTRPKLRVKRSALMGVACVALIPVHAVVLAFSCALAVPVVPLFGLPLFILAFPRPARLWADTVGIGNGAVAGGGDATSNGTAFYRHMLPSVTARISELMRGGVLSDVSAGDMLLLRVEPYLLWVHVMECGAGYAIVTAKGLELMTTSCHTAEANAIDEVIEHACASSAVAPVSGGAMAGAGGGAAGRRRENADDSDGDSSCSTGCGLFNPYAFYSFQPLGFTSVSLYSVTKTNLTGIIDVPDNLRAISTTFMRMFVVLLHRRAPNGDLRRLPDKWMITASTGAGAGAGAGAGVVSFGGGGGLVDLRTGSGGRSDATGLDSLSRRPAAMSSALSASSSSSSAGPVMGRATGPAMGGGPTMGGFTSGFGAGSGLGSGSASRGPAMGGGINLFATSSNYVPPFAIAKPPSTSVAGVGCVEDVSSPTAGVPITRNNLFGPPGPKQPAPVSAGPMAPGFGGGGGARGPVSEYELAPFRDRFPSRVLQHLTKAAAPLSDAHEQQFKTLVCSCFAIVESLGVFGPNAVTTPDHVSQTFGGRVGHSSALAWLKDDAELHELVMRAYRFSVKAVYDRAVMLELDQLLSDDAVADLVAAVQALECGDDAAAAANGDTKTPTDRSGASASVNGWHCGPANDAAWNAAVARGQRQLFAIAKGENSSYTSTTLQVTPNQRMAIGRLNAAAVNAVWASTSLELLYFANDDDERYSIQTHPVLLRNLCVQTAEPPLGYPVFGSTPIVVHS